MKNVLIKADGLKYRYKGSTKMALDDVSFEISKGEIVGIIGPNGAGKTTLCMAIKGIVPHKTGGAWGGSLHVCGNDIMKSCVSDITKHVAMTFQNPETQIVGTTVEEDLAFAPENLEIPVEEINRRIVTMMQMVRLSLNYKKRAPFNMSGGEKQRLAIAASIIASPDVIILDEPTTELDPVGKSEVLQIVKSLAEKGENTIIVVEQDIDYLISVADRLLVLSKGKLIASGKTRDVLEQTQLLGEAEINVPDVVRLWHSLGFKGKYPVFLTIEEACTAIKKEIEEGNMVFKQLKKLKIPDEQLRERIIEYEDTVFAYNEDPILKGVNYQVEKGDFVAVLGRNGAGKTTMVKHLNGLLKPTQGKVIVCGLDTKDYSVAALAKKTAYVFQNPDHQLFSQTVEEEISFGPRNLDWSEEKISKMVEYAIKISGLDEYRRENPLSLERGLKQILILASVIAMDVDVFVVDEPTTGLSKEYKTRIGNILDGLNKAGKTILLVTHDMRFVSEHANHIIVVKDGNVAIRGRVREVFRQGNELMDAYLYPPQITSVAMGISKEKFELTPLDNEEFLMAFEIKGGQHR